MFAKIADSSPWPAGKSLESQPTGSAANKCSRRTAAVEIRYRSGLGRSDNAPMTKGKRISADIGDDALQAIRELGAAAHVLGLLALYGIGVRLQQPEGR